ncbi:MAG: LysR family transcriptional regulator [Bacilli bacterium]|nr:LysR family transcriptional regulator [Bacilli bacterium]
MDIDFELYRVFNEVANAGNITAASERLHISQPAVSKSIKSLEEQLGGPLFIRTKRGVILTEEGRELHNYIRTAIEYIRNAEHKFSDMVNLDVGTIKIGISRTLVKFYLLPYLEVFHKKYPNIKIEILTNMASELVPKLRNGLIDMVIANMPMKPQSDIVVEKLVDIQDIFVVSRDYNIESYNINVEDLNNYSLILQPRGNNTRDYLDSVMAKSNVYLNPEMVLASYGLVEDMAKIGYGIGYVVEKFVTDELKNGNLVKININPPIPPRYIGLLTKKDTIPSFAAKKLIDLLKKAD